MYRFLVIAAILIYSALPAVAGVQVMDARFRADVPFPEYTQFWSDKVPAPPAGPLGGSIHVYIRNTGNQPVKIEDALIEGISLKRAIATSTKRKYKKAAYPGSIYFSDITKADRDKLISLGEPIWWKVEPDSIAPGAVAELTIRLRRVPKGTVHLALKTSEGMTQAQFTAEDTRPRFEGISFSRDFKQVYLYVRHPKFAPTKILMDGVEVTADIGHDAAVDVTPIVCKLKTPMPRGSFHTFQAVYADGSTAAAGIRAFADETMYGMWGARPGKASDLEIGRAHVEDMGLHNLNLEMPVIGSDAVRAFMFTPEGRKLLQKLGIRQIVSEPGKAVVPPWAYYLADEPDTADYRMTEVPAQSRIGCLAQGLITRAEEFRKTGPATPNMVNLDMTFKPENWYVYGQLPDIFAADPYYQTRLAQAYWEKPDTLPMFSKATFVYAVGSICRSACAPKPLHLMLNCTKLQKPDKAFRFAAPAEKRIELYYALASGAKSISYWWFIPSKPGVDGSSGVGADEPSAKALWKEIGLLGAEVRALDELLSMSCPASVLVKASSKVWVRTLLAGKDSLIILCVNDDYSCDKAGTNINPQKDVDVSVTLPKWLNEKSVFEVDCGGIHDLKSDASAGNLNLHLGTLDFTRLIIVSSDPALRVNLQKRYDTNFAANVRKLIGK